MRSSSKAGNFAFPHDKLLHPSTERLGRCVPPELSLVMLELDSTSSKLDLAVLELDSVMEVLDSEAPDFYNVLRSTTVVCPPCRAL